MIKRQFLRSFLLGLVCVFVFSGLPSLAALKSTDSTSIHSKYESSYHVIPIEEQPFYEELVSRADLWLHTPLGQVVGNSPRDTLLNFYAVMADVGIVIDDVTAAHINDPGWFWDRQTLAEMEEAEELFSAAVASLDASLFPQAVRPYLADEAAIQLKHVLDYVFHNSRQELTIPDASGMRVINDGRSKDTQSWTLPGSSIVMTSQLADDPANTDYFFSAETVLSAAQMYDHIRLQAEELAAEPFVAATFYQDFIHTPGHLFPPKWYLMMPKPIRGAFETEILLGETLFQVALSIIAVALFALVSLKLIQNLVLSYRDHAPSRDDLQGIWMLDGVAWKRVLIVLPILPLTKLTELFVDEYLNFTGVPLLVFTIVFEVLFFGICIVFSFLFFEALGRSLSEAFVKFSGSHESWKLLRTSNRIMPLCRISAGIISIFLIYNMLLQLGLSPTLVLALSTVPGLAIGLGASKLLSNLFAGLSLQTDRPLRVGEFCEIGGDLGFIRKIGLRSVELQTVTGIVTIPNSVAEETVVNNFSRNKTDAGSVQSQGLELRIDLDQDPAFGPDQITDLLELVRHNLASSAEFSCTCVTVEVDSGDQAVLVCIGLIKAQGWSDYLAMKERIAVRLKQLIDQVERSHFVLPVAYETSAEKLQVIPSLLRSVVAANPGFSMRACRLMEISEFSYDFKCHLFADCIDYKCFKDSIDRINKAILAEMAAQQIVIPYPTAIEIQRDD